MVSSGTEEHNATTAQPQVQAQPPQAVAGASAAEEQIPTTLTSKTIEMSDLPTTTGASLSTPEATTTAQPQTVPAAVVAPPPEQTTTTTNNPPHPDLNRSQTAELALGPDGEPAPSTDPSTPTLRITLMLTTGARHAYTISQKYLASRKVSALDASGNFDPREMSGYKLKELIWTDWRAEWEARPRDPSSIRLIIMGRMIDDKASLKGELFIPSDYRRATLTNPFYPRPPLRPTQLKRRPHDRETRRPARRRSRRRRQDWQQRLDTGSQCWGGKRCWLPVCYIVKCPTPALCF
jgi:hypothetical protein